MTPRLASISAEAYHAAAGISRSALEWITPPRTPAHFKARFIDKLIPDEDTPALRLGSITHRTVLEPDTMAGAFVTKPSGMKFTTKDGKEWRDAQTLPIMDAYEVAAMQGMRDAVWKHPLASRLLKGADCERSAFAEDKGLLLKSRFDALPPSSNAIVDLKTCDSADLASVEKAISKYGYYRQAAFYLKIAGLLELGRDLFAFIFVEKTPPFAVAVYQLADVVIEAGHMMISRDLQCLRNCMESGRWPGYGDGLLTAALPTWEMKQIEAIA